MASSIKKILAVLCSVVIAMTCATGIMASEPEKANFKVVDLSHWNNKVDWSKLSASVDGVILKIGFRGSDYHSSLKEDELFYRYYKEAVKYSVPVGCYFFTYAYNVADAIEEANWTINLLKKYNCKLDMPIYFDFEAEELQTLLNNRQRTDIAKAFCKTLSDNGFYAGIYANKYWATSLLYMSELSDYTLWVAQYNTACSYTGKYDMWQYTDSGSVNGVTGKVDISKCYRNFPKYIKENGYNLFGDGPEIPEDEKTEYNSKCGMYKTLKAADVRAGAADGSGYVGTLPASAEIYVYQASENWGRISFGNTEGYVKLDSSVQKTSDHISTSSGIGFYEVNTQNLNVRTGPSTSYSKDGQVHLGEKLFISKLSSGWGRFYYSSGKIGWVSLDYADFIGTVSFDSGIGEGFMAPQQAKTGQSVKLSKCTLTAEGFKFDGWSDKSGGSVKYADSSSVKIGSSNIVLYAVYSRTQTSGISFKTGAKFDSSSKVVAISDKKLTPQQFENKYVSVYGNASVSITSAVSSRIGTGSLITVTADGTKTVYTVAVKGDTNSDGVCDSLDLSDVLSLTQGAKKSGDYSAAQLNAMDVNGDGKVDSKDADIVKNAAFGLAVL